MKKFASVLMTAAIVVTLAVSVGAAPKVYEVKKAAAPVVCDGDLKEWAGITPIELKLSDGGAVKTYAMWDASALYFAFEVEDKVQANSQSGSNIWNGDSVQISLDPKNQKSAYGYGLYDYEFGYALTSLGKDGYAWHLGLGVKFDPAAQDYAIVHKDGVTVYEIVLTAAQIAPTVLEKGSTFGANVLVNDDDGDGRSFVEWTPGIGDSKDPSKYNNFTLVD